MATYQYPFKGTNRITCQWGKKGTWSAGWHVGVDIVGDDNKNMYPICSGVVQSINSKGSAYGNHILILQEDNRVALYAHLDSINVELGQQVMLDTCIGAEGSTGNVTGSHLHLELHVGSYKYPSGYTSATATWILDPVEEIESNLKMESEDDTMQTEQTVSSWAVDGYNYAVLNEISDGTRPKDVVTREELWVMLERFSKIQK